MVKACNGFCLDHFSLIVSEGEKKLSNNDYNELLDIIIPIELANLKRLEEEVEWFVNKFDYKYKDEPWKTSKDAIPRALTKVSSIFERE